MVLDENIEQNMNPRLSTELQFGVGVADPKHISTCKQISRLHNIVHIIHKV